MLKMFKKETELDGEIKNVLERLSETACNSEEYDVYLEKLDRLYKLKAVKAEGGIRPDTVALIAANLLGIILIIGYEQVHVISTKALGFVMKGRV